MTKQLLETPIICPYCKERTNLVTISDGVTRCLTCRHLLKKGELTMPYNIRDIIICLIISVLTWILALFIVNKLNEYEKRSTDKACPKYKIFKNMLQQRLVFINNVKEYTLIPTNRILIKSMDDTDWVFDIQYNYLPHFRFNYKYFENIVKNYNLDIIDLKNLMKHILYNRLGLNVQPIACNMP